jgi:trehalose-phosphatase
VGIVSGRSLADVRRLVRIPAAAYAGCHGLEIAWRGFRFRHPRAEKLLPVIKRVTRDLRRQTSTLRGVLVEPKGLTVSLHYRLADPAIVPTLKDLFAQVAREAPGLEILRGKKVLELRPRVGWGKAKAVELLHGLLGRSLGRQPALTLYLGDDETDEEAFRVLRGRAISVAVGRGRTRAAYHLREPAAVQAFLSWLARMLPEGPRSQAVR